MKRLGIMFAVSAFALAILPGSAVSQQKGLKDQIVGTWTLVSWEATRKDGTKNQRFGTNPKGVNTYDANGNFSLIIMRPDLPKIAAGDPEKPTPEEAQAIAKGAIAYYGTYTVNESDKTVSLKIGATTLVNQIGMEQKRVITSISADEMKYRNPTSTTGGQIELVWKRAK
jgi:Lipocalin-like domain